MADTKFSALPAASALTGTEEFGANQSGSKKVTVTQVKTFCSAAPTLSGHPTIEGVTTTGATGTGKMVFDGTPTLVTPNIGAATGTSLVLTGSVTSGSGGSVAGFAQMGQGTLPTVGTTAVTINAPAAVTSYTRTLEGAVNSSGFYFGTVSGSNVTDTKVGTTGFNNVVLATSPTLVTPILGTPSSGNVGSCTVDGTNLVGFRGAPQNSQSASYTTVLADAGKSIFHPVGDNSARTFTIDSNTNVAYVIGTIIEFINMAATASTIAITSDTMTLLPAGTTGSRTLAQYGRASAEKITSTSWIISGNSALT